MPPPSAAERSELITQLQQLNDVFDSLSDLVMAESVYHLVQSNTPGASAAFDAAIGQPAPDPAVVQQPRGGTSLTHRLAVGLGDDPVVLPGKNPRGKAEPYLHTWVGSLLGDLTKVVCKVDFISGALVASSRNVTAADLGLEPLDWLSLTRSVAIAAVASDAHATELDRRVRDVILKLDKDATDIKITYDIPPADTGWKEIRTGFRIGEVDRRRSFVGAGTALRRPCAAAGLTRDPNPAPPDTRAANAVADFNAVLTAT